MSARTVLLITMSALGFTACATSGGSGGGDKSASPAIAAAVADPSRPDADKARDADRKPAEMLAFAGVKPGMKIGEIWPGGGYYTRIFAKTVGPKGVVYALVPSRAPNAPANAPDPAAGMTALAASPGYANLHVLALGPTGGPAGIEPVDLMWTSDNYHDFHNRPNADLLAMNKAVLAALKPGGIYIVIDHAAEPGSGARDTSTLHRIDPALAKTELLAAGFEFVGESNALRNPADAHAVLNREPSVRGKTDQFAYKFRKPKK
jgi:predicted methyltransferase